MIQNPLFFTIHNKNGVLLQNFKVLMALPRARSVDQEPIVYNDEPTRLQTCDDDTSLFPLKPASRLGSVLEKRWSKKGLVDA